MDDTLAWVVILLAALVSAVSAWFTHRSTRRALRRLELERDALAKKAAELHARADQLRIARELHDGIGAHLVALVWRTQRLQRQVGAEHLADIERLQALAHRALDDLRSTVWSLRRPIRAWPEVVDYVRTRLAERPVGGATVVDTSAPEAMTRELPAELGQTLLRALVGLPSGALVTMALEHDAMRVTFAGQELNLHL